MPTAAGLYYSEYGREVPGKPVVILIHGAGMNHQAWPVEIRHLPGWHVLCLDLPGHGQSAGPGSQTIQASSDNLLQFLEAMDLFKPVLVGHGMGGAIALSFTQQYPERTTLVGLIAAAARFSLPQRLIELLSVPSGLPAAAEYFLELSSSPGMPPAMAGKIRKLLGAVRPGVLRDDLLACSEFHISLAGSWFSRPALILAGSEDCCVSYADIRHLARYIPDCTLHHVQGAGHMPMLERPRQAATVLANFLAEKLPAD